MANIMKNAIEMLSELSDRDIKVAVDDGALKIDAPKGALDQGLRDRLVEVKPQMIKLLTPPWVIDYEPGNLRGVMPDDYEIVEGKVRAHYRTIDELRRHIDAVNLAHLVEMVEGLGGVVVKERENGSIINQETKRDHRADDVGRQQGRSQQSRRRISDAQQMDFRG